MTFGGALVDAQPLGDLSIRQTLADEVGDLLLSLGEARNGGLARWEFEKAVDLADKEVDVADIREMRSSRKLDQPRASDASRNQLALRQRCSTVVCSMERKCRSSDLSEAIDHVDVVAGSKEIRCHFRRRRLTLIFGKSSPGGR